MLATIKTTRPAVVSHSSSTHGRTASTFLLTSYFAAEAARQLVAQAYYYVSVDAQHSIISSFSIILLQELE